VADVKQSAGLQTIFAIFLGLMVTAFVGVGVYTFYPSPQAQFTGRIVDLNRQQTAIRNAKDASALSASDRAKIQELEDEGNRIQDEANAAVEVWGRQTSIILIVFATLVMAISLVRAEQLPVISNGLLLGGVFTMIYGVGWIVATGTSKSRFVVMSIALLITLVLGYLRFVRLRAPFAQSRDALPQADGLAALELRVRGLEQRMDQAATALGRQI
jgi:hypothetical protein